MKNIIIIAIALFSTGTIFAQTDKFAVTVEGLGCPFCAYGLEKKFKELKVAKDIKIEITTGVMTFTADASNNLSIETVDKQVDKAGYTTKNVKIIRSNGKVENSNLAKTVAMKGAIAETFKVGGNCGMCKSRIEKAATSLDGVTAAEWNEESKMITVKYDAEKVSLTDIHNKIASVGHDTDKVKAKDEVYNKLHGCCKYERN